VEGLRDWVLITHIVKGKQDYMLLVDGMGEVRFVAALALPLGSGAITLGC